MKSDVGLKEDRMLQINLSDEYRSCQIQGSYFLVIFLYPYFQVLELDGAFNHCD